MPITRFQWLLLIFVSMILAFLSNQVWRQTKVDVGLDVIQSQLNPPILVWGNRLLEQKTMEPVEERFTFSKRFVVLSPLEQQNPQSSSTSVLLQVPDIFASMPCPCSLWTRYGNVYISVTSDHRKSIAWLGGPYEPLPVLRGGPQSGIVRMWTWWSNEVVDLYRVQEEAIPLPIHEPPIRRYHASLPRFALSRLQIIGLENPADRMIRLYLGTSIPVVYTTNTSIPQEYIWGKCISNYYFTWNQPIRLPFIAQIDQGNLLTSILFFLIWLSIGILSIATWHILKKTVHFCLHTDLPNQSLYPFSLLFFLLFMLPAFSIWFFMLLCFYPGCMSSDSLLQWAQAQDMVFNTHHPILSTFLIRVLTWIWDSPASVAVFQIILLSGLVGYGYSLLWRAGINRWLIGLFYLLCLFSPRNANYVIVIWKDIPYTITLAALTFFLIHLLLENRLWQKNWPWVILGSLVGLTPFFRYNGILVCLGMLFLLIPVLARYKKQLILTLSSSLTVVCLVYFGLFSLLNTNPGYSKPYYMITARLAALIYQDIPFSQEEYEFLHAVRSLDDRWLYQRFTADQIIFSSKSNERFAVDHMDRYKSLFFSTWLRFPYLMLRSLYETTSSFFSPFPANTLEINVTSWHQFPANDLGLSMQSFFPKVQAWLLFAYEWTNREPQIYFIWRPGYHFLIVLLAFALIYYRLKDIRYLLIYAPVILNTVSVVGGAVAQDVRYQFPLTFLSGFLLCLVFLPEKNSKLSP